MARRTPTTVSDFYCTQCGKQGIMIPRKVNAQREAGHLKKMYCLHCKQEHNFVEIRPFGMEYRYEDFLLEFEKIITLNPISLSFSIKSFRYSIIVLPLI